MNVSHNLGKGRAQAITDQDIYDLAQELRCSPAVLEAIAKVESNGFGWFPDGRIKILWEAHWFYRLLDKHRPDLLKEAVKKGLARKKWVSPKNGGYKNQNKTDDRYRLLQEGIDIHQEIALSSISVGKFQIMGFNHKLCGYDTATHMWVDFPDSEVNQLKAFAAFLKNKKLGPALRSEDFDRIETVYNGGGLGGVYADRMRKEAKALKFKWAKFEPGAKTKPAAKPQPLPFDEPAVEIKEPVQDKHSVLLLLLEGLLKWLFGPR